MPVFFIKFYDGCLLNSAIIYFLIKILPFLEFLNSIL